MGKRLELAGKKFNLLTGIKFIKINKHGLTVWLFSCDCGNTLETVGGYVTSGHTKSCGCLQSSVAANHCKQLKGGPNKLPDGLASFNGLYGSYKRNCRKSGRGSFDLTYDQFREITSSNCFYCGAIPAGRFRKSLKCNGDYIYNGIDRIDNSVGYVFSNCVPCCKICNYMKHALAVQEFLFHIEKIHNHQNGK